MMKKLFDLNLRKRLWRIMKENKVLSIASIVFITFSFFNFILIYNFVQVLETL